MKRPEDGRSGPGAADGGAARNRSGSAVAGAAAGPSPGTAPASDRPSASLSVLLRYHAVDPAGTRARIRDLVLDLREPDEPPVTAILVDAPGGPALIRAIGRLDPVHRVFRVAGLVSAPPADRAALDRCVLARRDVLDAAVLDLRQRCATRVNDLVIEELDGHLVLAATDVSRRALVRRATLGLLHLSPRPCDILEWRRVEYLRGDPAAALAGHDAHGHIAGLPPDDIARLLDAVPCRHAAELLSVLPAEIATSTLEAVAPERRSHVFEALAADRRRRVLELMEPEAAADLLGRLASPDAQAELERLPPTTREQIAELLRDPATPDERPPGGATTPDPGAVRDRGASPGSDRRPPRP